MKQAYLFETVLTKASVAIICTKSVTAISKAIVPMSIGNAGSSTSFPVTLATFFPSLVSACIVAPIWEELIFRALPIFILEMVKIKYEVSKISVFCVNVLTSVIFAYGHNFVINIGNPLTFTFIPGWLPIPQFVYGLFLFHIAYVHGVVYSMLTHAYANLLTMIVLFLYLIF